jgi:hypothetical protein
MPEEKKNEVMEKTKKIKEKKRTKKNKKEASSAPSEPSENSSTGDESSSAQKRKGTIWKIIFPELDMNDKALKLERKVCSQVEAKVDEDPTVKKWNKKLKDFESSKESSSMSKDDFTKQKNRISAQLSRVRRNAIMQSLIQVCIFNIKAKMEQDEDIEEVKQVLKEHLCTECKGKFTGSSCPNSRPSTLSHAPSSTSSQRVNRPAITFSRGGAFNIFMSLALVACIMSVAFIGTGENNNGPYPALDVSNPSSGNRYLREVEEQLPIPVCSETQIMRHQQDFDRMLK